MERSGKKVEPASALSPSMSKKLSAALEWSILERELDAHRLTSYDPSVLFDMKVVNLDEEIERRIMILERLGVPTSKLQETLMAADELLNLLASTN